MSFYNNEEQKMAAYKANLKKEAANQFKQGEKLNEYLLYQKGIETQERGLNKFAEAIGSQVGQNVGIVGKVNKLAKFKAANQPSVYGVDEFGNVISGVKPKKVTFKNENAIYGVDEFGNTIKSKTPKQPKSAVQPPRPLAMKSINTEPERNLMSMEDVNTNTLVSNLIKPSGISSTDLAAQRDAQAKLDLISLFQQDVKEGRKRQTAIDLKNLSDTEDARIRQNFMQALDDMMDEVNLRESEARKRNESRKKFEEQKLMIDKIQNLIENNRMHDSFLEFSKIASQNEFRKKIARNLEAAFFNKKFMEDVKNLNKASKIEKAERANMDKSSHMALRDFTKNLNETHAMAKKISSKKVKSVPVNNQSISIAQRMAELRARKAEKSRALSESTDATDIGSLTDISFRGRPPTLNLAAKRLDKFQELEANDNKTDNQKKQQKNLQGQLFRKPMSLEDKPKHRPTRGSNLRKK